MKPCIVAFVAASTFSIIPSEPAFAAVSVSLVGTLSRNSDSIPNGTATYSLALLFDSDGNTVSGLQYYFETDPPNTIHFGAVPVTALNAPFIAADLFSAPQNNAIVAQGSGTTVWFKSRGTDYPAVNGNAIARYEFDTSSLPIGTYRFTPVGQEMTNAQTVITSFGAPGEFTLHVVPEPGCCALLFVGGTFFLSRRWRGATIRM